MFYVLLSYDHNISCYHNSRGSKGNPLHCTHSSFRITAEINIAEISVPNVVKMMLKEE